MRYFQTHIPSIDKSLKQKDLIGTEKIFALFFFQNKNLC